MKSEEIIKEGNEEINLLGYPIFLDDYNLVIGMNYKSEQNKNYGYFIGPIIDSLKNNYIVDKKEYEIGIYEGEFNNNLREGYGKFILKMVIII